MFRLRGYCKLIRLRVGNEGDFSVRCVLVKVRDGFPSHNPSVLGTLSLRIFFYFNINRKCAPFVMKPETTIMALGDWIGNRD